MHVQTLCMVACMDVCMFRWEMWHLRCPVRLATIQYHHSMYNMCKGKVETLYWCTHTCTCTCAYYATNSLCMTEIWEVSTPCICNSVIYPSMLYVHMHVFHDILSINWPFPCTCTWEDTAGVVTDSVTLLCMYICYACTYVMHMHQTSVSIHVPKNLSRYLFQSLRCSCRSGVGAYVLLPHLDG